MLGVAIIGSSEHSVDALPSSGRGCRNQALSRKQQSGGGSDTDVALQNQAAAMELDQSFHERQAEAGAGSPGRADRLGIDDGDPRLVRALEQSVVDSIAWRLRPDGSHRERQISGSRRLADVNIGRKRVSVMHPACAAGGRQVSTTPFLSQMLTLRNFIEISNCSALDAAADVRKRPGGRGPASIQYAPTPTRCRSRHST